MKKFLFLLIFLSSCTFQNKNDISAQKFDFSVNMKFEDFKQQLENYAKDSFFPNIDE